MDQPDFGIPLWNAGGLRYMNGMHTALARPPRRSHCRMDYVQSHGDIRGTHCRVTGLLSDIGTWPTCDRDSGKLCPFLKMKTSHKPIAWLLVSVIMTVPEVNNHDILSAVYILIWCFTFTTSLCVLDTGLHFI